MKKSNLIFTLLIIVNTEWRRNKTHSEMRVGREHQSHMPRKKIIFMYGKMFIIKSLELTPSHFHPAQFAVLFIFCQGIYEKHKILFSSK